MNFQAISNSSVEPDSKPWESWKVKLLPGYVIWCSILCRPLCYHCFWWVDPYDIIWLTSSDGIKWITDCSSQLPARNSTVKGSTKLRLAYVLLQSFLEAHFVYLCLVRSLELSLALSLSPILSYVLDRSGPLLWLSHVHDVRYLFTCYLPFIICLRYSHVNRFHMLIIITCLPFYLI